MNSLIDKATTICFDADDTTNNHLSVFVRFHNSHYGTSLTLADFYTRQLGLVIGCNDEETMKRMDEFQHSDAFQHIVPLEKTLQAIRLFYDSGKKLVIVTSREDSLKHETERFYDFYLPGKIQEIIHSSNGHTGQKNSGKTKAEIRKSFGNAILIDDDPLYLTPGDLLFGDYAWQRDADKWNFERLKKWGDLNAN